jgi:transcriptional regulator with XRE-family HTH domain
LIKIFPRMPNYFATNLVFVRKLQKLTQEEAATALGFKRSTYSNYESEHTEPDLEGLKKITSKLGISLDVLLFTDFRNVQLTKNSTFEEFVQAIVQPSIQPFPINGTNHVSENEVAVGKNKSQELDALSPSIVTVDTEGKAIAVMVSVKEREAYLAGFSNEDYISTLPIFRLPYKDDVAFRIFEVQGVSMLPTMQDEDLAISRWVGVSGLKDDRVHVLITRSNGILIKRVLYRQNEGKVICMSDHNERGLYPNIVLEVADILEAWYVVEKMTKHLPAPGEIYKRINDLEADMALIKQAIARGERLR